jgi:arylsulfatase A-like enzyme
MSAPNILFILVDDLGWRDLSCYGSTFYQTPNLDRLMAQGMRFTDAYASCPVCSPTRASILTGKYPANVGITDWIDWEGTTHPAKGCLVDVPYLKHLPDSEYSLASALRDSGYRTWHVGKWHLGGLGSLPQDHGFDVNIGGCELGSPYPGGYFSPWSIPPLREDNVPDGTYLTDYLTDRAIALLREPSDRPFFLNMWYYSVHTPIQAKPDIVRKYESKAKAMGLDTVEAFEDGGLFPCQHKRHLRIRRRLIQSDPTYAAMVESLDENVGRLLAKLDAQGLFENTLVIFTSDNGGLATAEGSPTSNAPLAEGKGWMYEGGTREPLIVRWPGHVQPQTACSVPVTSTDFYPTILDAAGLPLLPDQHCDGVSLLPLLSGEQILDREAIFWHYPHYGNQGGTPGSSVRMGDFKVIEFFEDQHVELYNLKEDPGETRNLASDRPGLAATLLASLHTWQGSVEAKIPAPNPDWRGSVVAGRPVHVQ